ncbi:TIGR04282 family arsenosugar biosynthesis glycosyltransferase [Roseovarius pacificus]|uniref:TIGR04282 family arsenosugar biosynthesis glycosyltransferase n=1 Tax=Roseovarius pacificus TaxID=337701 RepID=UPI002A187B0F|nr:TIGR04282 family arsenosugar biosynthesis glycosyltransferase [Roseovarius pacificus]
MYEGLRVSVVIPAYNEAGALGYVIDDIPPWADEVVVCDNGSTDGTAAVARSRGARVVEETERGYGAACLAALAALDNPDVVVFLDGDHSDYPEQMDELLGPIAAGEAQLVVGSRVLGDCAPGALTPQARFGNWLATRLLRLFWGARYTDLGPFRAIRFDALQRIGMADRDYGWTIEMQVKAAILGVPATEVPVGYRKRRAGKSKVSGTVRGIWGAGTKILGTIFRAAVHPPVAREQARLLVFARWPEPGTTKTRLIPALGAAGAAELQRAMTEHTLAAVGGSDASIEIRHTGENEQAMRAWLGAGFRYALQGEGDLGARMHRALCDAFAGGARKAVLIGTDCPNLSAAHVTEALLLLDTHGLVLGPAADGGYYLIALRADAGALPPSTLFEGIRWGGGDVLTAQVAQAELLGLDHALLETLHDVDRPEDLPVWEAAQSRKLI